MALTDCIRFKLTVVLSIVAAALTAAKPEYKPPFGGKSFSLRSTVHVHTFGGSGLMSEIFESYSIEQRRARIEYQTIDDDHPKDESGIFLIDANQDIAIEYDAMDDECKLTNIKSIQETLSVRPLEGKDDYITEDYIAGPARLIFFVEKHRAQMKLTPIDKDLRIRNLKCLMYIIDYKTEAFQNIQIAVFYSESSTAIDKQPTVPVQIAITELDSNLAGKETIIVDYSRVELLSEGSLMRLERRHHDLDGDVVLDEFAFIPAIGCSQKLYDKQVDVFIDRPPPTKFSFKAKIQFQGIANQPPVELKTFVAYDAKLASMRYDIYENSIYKESTSGVKSQIFNFKLDRMYHAMQRVAGSKTIIDQILNLSDESDLETGAKTQTTQCMVARISENVKENSNFNTIGQLLVGATKFVYMGQAQVRGIEAKVYEASEGTLPFWLDQPMVYMSRSQEWKLRSPDVGARPSHKNLPHTHNILLYFGEKDLNKPLLLIEIYRLHKETFEVYDKQTIHLYDFVWDLIESPSGVQVSDLFSLADICSEDSVAHAKVDMLLESDKPIKETESSLDNTNYRNLALIGGIQDGLNLPATMIYDMESKLVKATKNRGSDGAQALIASFKFSAHTSCLVDLVYLDQGRQSVKYSGPRSTIYIRSFQACFFLAAHRRADIVFGYDIETHKCSFDFNPLSAPDTVESNNSAFVLDPNESMEIFRINYRDDYRHSFLNSWMQGNRKYSNNFNFLGKKINLLGVESSVPGDVEFTIKRVRKKGGIIPTKIEGDNDSNEDLLSKKITGFGLIETEPGNRRVRPVPLGANNWSPMSHQLEDQTSLMTYDQCHAACLSDFDCRSFSVCIQDGELDCVVSNVNFNSPIVLKKLSDVRRKSSSLMRKANQVEVELEKNQTVKLSLHLNCELHNKDFSELFKEPIYAEHTFTNRRIYPVQRIEECAEKCFYQSLKALSGDMHRTKEVFSKLSPNPKTDDDSLQKLIRKHRKAVRELCKVFYYLDSERLAMKDFTQEVLDAILDKDKIDSEQVTGYCMLGSRRTDNETQELIEAGKFRPDVSKNNYMFLEMYDFKADFFYEKQHGVSLKQSPMTAEEQQAYRSAMEVNFKRGANVSEKSVSILKSFIEKGNNIQEYLSGMEKTSSKCALVCFIQTQGPWPACRSFDIIIRLENNTYILECHLNSITLHQATSTERFDLIEDGSSNVQMWHYEPRAGFVLDESILSGEIAVAEESLWVSLKSHAGIRLHGFATFFLILFGTITGVYIGVRAGQHIVNKNLETQRAHNMDKQVLVGPTSIEFVNQVNSEGSIPT